ncbi:hypothetical protein GOP47_0029811 [Adiantum capillus-veneris]|nr:hypothetical protein GOP47_0029811 [Adiantum capillus-veneris]
MASDAGQLYYCHQCARAVRSANPSELICPNCNGDFLEEWSDSPPDATAPAAPPYPAGIEWAYMAPGFGQLLEDMSSFLTHMHMVQAAETGAEPDNLNPILVLRGRIQNLLSMHNRELPLENGAGGPPHRLPGSIGDYFIGPGFEQLLQQLAANDPNRYGAPPASKSAVEALPIISISEEHLGTDAAYCAVCKDEFELCTEVKQMPCKHLYHADCILPWLEQHNSCPVCRYELPTDDPDYERGGLRTGSSSDVTGVRGMLGAGVRGPGGFSIQGIPRQFLLGRQARETNISVQQQEQRPFPSQDNNGRGREGSQGTGRRFSLTFPWFRGFTTAFTSPANAPAGSGSQSNSAETVSSGPGGGVNEVVGQVSIDRRDDAGDSDMSDGRQGPMGS